MRHLGWLSRSTASGTLNTNFPLQLDGSKDKLRQVNIKERKETYKLKFLLLRI
jgi:hypothetical protein